MIVLTDTASSVFITSHTHHRTRASFVALSSPLTELGTLFFSVFLRQEVWQSGQLSFAVSDSFHSTPCKSYSLLFFPLSFLPSFLPAENRSPLLSEVSQSRLRAQVKPKRERNFGPTDGRTDGRTDATWASKTLLGLGAKMGPASELPPWENICHVSGQKFKTRGTTPAPVI